MQPKSQGTSTHTNSKYKAMFTMIPSEERSHFLLAKKSLSKAKANNIYRK